jgi:hypothetical protein
MVSCRRCSRLTFHSVPTVLWEFQKRRSAALPSSDADAAELKAIAKEILPQHAVDPSLLSDAVLEYVSPTVRLITLLIRLLTALWLQQLMPNSCLHVQY